MLPCNDAMLMRTPILGHTEAYTTAAAVTYQYAAARYTVLVMTTQQCRSDKQTYVASFSTQIGTNQAARYTKTLRD